MLGWKMTSNLHFATYRSGSTPVLGSSITRLGSGETQNVGPHGLITDQRHSDCQAVRQGMQPIRRVADRQHMRRGLASDASVRRSFKVGTRGVVWNETPASRTSRRLRAVHRFRGEQSSVADVPERCNAHPTLVGTREYHGVAS